MTATKNRSKKYPKTISGK